MWVGSGRPILLLWIGLWKKGLPITTSQQEIGETLYGRTNVLPWWCVASLSFSSLWSLSMSHTLQLNLFLEALFGKKSYTILCIQTKVHNWFYWNWVTCISQWMGCSMLKDNFKHDVLDLSSSIGGRSAEWNEIGFSLLMISCASFVKATNIAVLHLLDQISLGWLQNAVFCWSSMARGGICDCLPTLKGGMTKWTTAKPIK